MRIEDIEKVFDKLTWKCLTKARIHEKLSEMSQLDKSVALYGKLNQGEEEEYNRYIKMADDFRNQISLFTKLYGEEYTKGKRIIHQRKLDKVNDRLFMYERRIFENYTPPVREVPTVDISRFKADSQGDSRDYTGEMEKAQVEAQSKTTYTESEVNGLTEWWGASHWEINSSIYNGEHWNSMSEGERKIKKSILSKTKQNITSAINRSEGLLEDMVLFRGENHFDVTQVPGDRIRLKGYTSMSFSKKVAEGFKGDDGYLVNYLMYKGTKGVCGNAEGVGNHHQDEHEYLKGRDLQGTIIDIDYDNHEVTVLVDKDG